MTVAVVVPTRMVEDGIPAHAAEGHAQALRRRDLVTDVTQPREPAPRQLGARFGDEQGPPVTPVHLAQQFAQRPVRGVLCRVRRGPSRVHWLSGIVVQAQHVQVLGPPA